jgi:Type IV secretory pathway, component VirB8
MSAPTVMDEYQRAFLNTSPGSTSPQIREGRKGQVNVSLVNMSFVRRQVALVRYRRTVLMYGSDPVTTTWTATVEFRLASKLPLGARLADPGGLIVTNYQNSEDTP